MKSTETPKHELVQAAIIAAQHRPGRSTTPVFTRDDEAGFRAAVPATVNRFPILFVGRYVPGGSDTYASAYVLSTEDRHHPGMFSTHMLVFFDERGEWFLAEGNYCLTLTEAAADLDQR